MTSRWNLIRKAIVLNAQNPFAHSNLAVGEAFRKMGRLDEAIANYRRALELKPDHAEASNNLGLAFRDRGQLAEAMAAYRRALQLQPRYADAHYNLGNCAPGARRDRRSHWGVWPRA